MIAASYEIERGRIVALFMEGAFASALEASRRLLAVHAERAETLNLIGACLDALGRRDEAEDAWRRAVAVDPNCALVWNNLGKILMARGAVHEAQDAYTTALHLDPVCIEAWNNLGLLEEKGGNIADAEAHFRKSLSAHADYATGRYNLGRMLLFRHACAEATTQFLEVLRVAPNYPQAQACLGQALAAQGRYDEAEAAYRSELTRNGTEMVALTSLGLLHQKLRRLDEARDCFRRAANAHPHDATCLSNYANILTEPAFRRNAEALHYYRAAVTADPSFGSALAKWMLSARAICDWSDLGEVEDRLVALADDPGLHPPAPFNLLNHPRLSGARHRHFAQSYVARICGPELFGKPRVEPGRVLDSRAGPLRIGYLGSTFNEHPVMQLLGGVLDAHDPGRVAFVCYSIGSHIGATHRTRIEAARACAGFHDVAPLSDQAVADRIADDRIDILVDLNGFTQESRPTIQALRPAPVLVNWLGYPGTLGSPRLADYIIGDPVITPLSAQDDYSETLALLPHCYMPYGDWRILGPCPDKASVGLPQDGLVFAGFHAGYKLTPATFALWARLLREVPDSVLWLLDPGEGARTQLVQHLALAGVAGERLIFAPKVPPNEHFDRLQLVDLALDVYPYTSHATAADAFNAGVPLVTRMGETFTSRVAASLLTAVGLPELITLDDEACFAKMLHLARDPKERLRLRRHLLKQKASSPLYDTRRFTHNLETLFEQIQEQTERGERCAITIKENGRGDSE